MKQKNISDKGFSYIILAIILFVVFGIAGYFIFSYYNSKPNLVIFEDPQRRFTFEYNEKYQIDTSSNNQKELSIDKPLKLTRNVTLKTGKDVIYEITFSILKNKPEGPIPYSIYYKEYDNYFLKIEHDINPLTADYPLPDENLKEVENDMTYIVNSLKVSKPLFNFLDLSKAKKIDKLTNGYLVVLEKSIFMTDSTDSVSYLAVVPNLDDKITQENISILASYKNPNKFSYTIYGDDIYYIDTTNSFSNPENGGKGIPIYEEQNIYKFNLNEMSKKKLLNNKFKNPTYESGDNQFIRRLIFNENKMYFVTNSTLYDYDLSLGKSSILKILPKKQGVMLGVDEAFGPNIIEKIENNKLFLNYDTCPFISDRQGGCNPGGYQLTYNLQNNEIKEERFDPDYRENECNITKVENGKLVTAKYEKILENEQCQKKFKLVESNYSIKDPFIQRK